MTVQLTHTRNVVIYSCNTTFIVFLTTTCTLKNRGYLIKLFLRRNWICDNVPQHVGIRNEDTNTSTQQWYSCFLVLFHTLCDRSTSCDCSLWSVVQSANKSSKWIISSHRERERQWLWRLIVLVLQMLGDKNYFSNLFIWIHKEKKRIVHSVTDFYFLIYWF